MDNYIGYCSVVREGIAARGHLLPEVAFAERRNTYHNSCCLPESEDMALSRRNKNATIAGFRLENCRAVLAVVKPLTGVYRHRFCFDVPAFGTGNR